MFDAYKRFFRFSGAEKGTWYKGMAFELLRSIFEAFTICRSIDSVAGVGRTEHDRGHRMDGFGNYGG